VTQPSDGRALKTLTRWGTGECPNRMQPAATFVGSLERCAAGVLLFLGGRKVELVPVMTVCRFGIRKQAAFKKGYGRLQNH
jgi:hypothetical protein